MGEFIENFISTKRDLKIGLLELNALRKIKSNTIPRLISFEIKDNRIVINKSLIYGQKLSEFFKEKSNMRHIDAILDQSIKSLHDIHTQGWFLRDIKPESIIVDACHRVYFVDLLSASPQNETHHLDSTFGSFDFKAPEAVFSASEYSSESEFYMLGKCFLHAIRNYEGYIGLSTLELLNQLTAIVPEKRKVF